MAELTAEGHNDAVLIFFVLLSVYLFLQRRVAGGVLAIGIGALVKIVSPLVAPLEIVYAWRTRQRRRLVAGLLIGSAWTLLIAAAAYARFWIGAATFDGLRAHSHPSIAPSTDGPLLWLLTRSHAENASAMLLSVCMTTAFLGCMAAAALTVKNARGMLRACGWVAFAYLVVAPAYWPWYACLPVALLALFPSDLAVAAIMAVSIGSRLAAPIDVLRLDAVMSWPQEVVVTTLIGIWVPATAVAVFAVWRWWRRFAAFEGYPAGSAAAR